MNAPDLTIQLVLMRLLAGIIIAVIQGTAIAAVAVLLGDKGPRHDGRVNLLTPHHISLLGLGSLMLTGYGWGQPVSVEADKMRAGRLGLVLAVLGGSAALLALAVLLLLLAGPMVKSLDFSTGMAGAAFVRLAARLCVWMALFSLLPIPPLAGAHFLAAIGISIPRQAGVYFGWALLLASLIGVTQKILTPAYNIVAPLLLGVDIAL